MGNYDLVSTIMDKCVQLWPIVSNYVKYHNHVYPNMTYGTVDYG